MAQMGENPLKRLVMLDSFAARDLLFRNLNVVEDAGVFRLSGAESIVHREGEWRGSLIQKPDAKDRRDGRAAPDLLTRWHGA